jgi:hypothetical protein
MFPLASADEEMLTHTNRANYKNVAPDSDDFARRQLV